MPKGEHLWLPPDIYKPKYICLWEMPDGRYVGDSDGNYLVAESLTEGDSVVESKMRSVVEHYGIDGGRPVWQLGRKVTAMESDDQMERLLDGKVPDEQEAALIEIEEQLEKKRHGIS